MFVLGTAGHVDHGKSTLLRALTGMEPDRLPEEKSRGMTIDLNFVWFESHKHGRVGIIDVPGHARHLKNMTTGVAAIDAFVFLVAADDGWMPQSEEHFQILKGLGVNQGIVVLSKTDRVDNARLLLLKESLATKFREGFGHPIAISFFSISDPATLIQFQLQLNALLSELSTPDPLASAELWVDREFTPKGLGTIVTGTLKRGSLSIGQKLYLYPESLPVEIKSMQTYGVPLKTAETAETGQTCRASTRVAIQLTKMGGLKPTRGDFLSADPHLCLSASLEVLLSTLLALPNRNIPVSVHFGTNRTPAMLIPILSEKDIYRLKLERPLPFRINDRFILRSSNEERTLATGMVSNTEVIRSHRATIDSWCRPPLTPSQFLTRQMNRHGILRLRNLAQGTPWSTELLKQEIQTFEHLVDDFYIHCRQPTDSWSAIAIKLRCSSGYQIDPIKLERELKQRCGEPLAQTALNPLQSEGLKNILNGASGLPFSGNEMKTESLPLLKEACKLNLLKALNSNYYIEYEKYVGFREKVALYFQTHVSATTSELKQLLNLSRKPTVLILEQLDRDRLTYLKDGVRRLL